MSLAIRPEQQRDVSAIAAVIVDAFGDEGRQVALLAERIRASDNYEPDLSLVAEDETGVIGHVLLSWVGLENPVRDRALVLTPMSVRRDRQRAGVGTQLVRGVLERADERREPLVLVEGVPGYYPRFGFERASLLGFEPPHAGVPDEAFMVKRLRPYDGSIRGRVLYPTAFDGLEA